MDSSSSSSLAEEKDIGGEYPYPPFPPPLLELVAASELESQLAPAFQRVLSLLAAKFPATVAPLLAWRTEAFALLFAAIQNHFLSAHSASFGEYFYGLRREPSTTSSKVNGSSSNSSSSSSSRSGVNGIGRRRRALTLALLVLVPYISEKGRQWANRQSSDTRTPTTTTTDSSTGSGSGRSTVAAEIGDAGAVGMWARRCRRIAAIVLPYCRATARVASLLFQLSYGFFGTRYYSPALALTGLTVRLSDGTDLENDSIAAETLAYARKVRYAAMSPWRRVANLGLDAAISVVTTAIPLGLGLVAFAEWYAETRDETQVRPVPPPPRDVFSLRSSSSSGSSGGGGSSSSSGFRGGSVESIAATALLLPSHKKVAPGYCPLCREPLTNPAVLPSANRAFCYACIFEHIKENNTCPFSGLPVRTDQLIRVYRG